MYDVLIREEHEGRALGGGEGTTRNTLPDLFSHSERNGGGRSDHEVDRTFRFLIGGKLVRPDQVGSFSMTSSGGELLAVVGEANRKDVRNAVEAARGAFPSWFASDPHLRAQILYFWAENLGAEKHRFAAAITAQTGCTTDTSESEVQRAISRLFDFAAYADKFGGTVQPVLGRRLVVGLREPVGVVGIRAADDSPLLGLISVIAPAVAMANTVVVVSGKYALTAMDLIQVLQHSDVPAGVINVLTAQNPDAIAKILAEHEDVDGIWFFGDSRGSKIVEEVSIGNMKQTWVSDGRRINWDVINRETLLLKSTQVKNIWVPYGV
jgi:aldehyde dehydrogenase (NAD+)